MNSSEKKHYAKNLVLEKKTQKINKVLTTTGTGILFIVTSLSTLVILFMLFFIARDALPFFKSQGFREFFTSTKWYPSSDNPEFGALAIFFGTGIVTLGSTFVAVPLGISAAVCLSDILPFSARQVTKPVIEILAAIPSVAYGFFALVVFAPLLQNNGGYILKIAFWVISIPLFAILITVAIDVMTDKIENHLRMAARWILGIVLGGTALFLLIKAGLFLDSLKITSGTNALNVSIILGIMALPTVVSVSEDALQSVGRELREGSYALGATRAETILLTVIPAASSGIAAAVILGIMRAIGETMVVWMASGNASQIPVPWYNLLEPVRTLTATIAGDMGEADHVTGSARYHVLFAMALSLLVISLICNLITERIITNTRRKISS
ncbi:MAG: phosphate ABC transporter permease [Lentisphaerae bacterium RIFOXYA12_FULL_48_11]|nr:MAG: phosphate ABC transporter permease [Lentisphaerae bacterium RIFOXYA12_FULL_48_11]